MKSTRGSDALGKPRTSRRARLRAEQQSSQSRARADTRNEEGADVTTSLFQQDQSMHPAPTRRSSNGRFILVVVSSAIVICLWIAFGTSIGRHKSPSTDSAKAPRLSTITNTIAGQKDRRSTNGTVPSATATRGGTPKTVATPPRRIVGNGPPAVGEPWALTFDGDFSGSTLDSSKWSSCYPWGCFNEGNPETEWYQAQNVSVDNGVAVITSDIHSAHGRPYSSDLIQTNGHFTFRYGYAEIRVHLPSGKGSWPAFWMLSANYQFPPEIDVFEGWGSHPDRVMNGVHYGKNVEANVMVNVPNLSSGYHTFGVDWEPHSLTWYIDGVETYSVNVSIGSTMYLLANVAQLGTPATNGESGYPSAMSIEYVRVWQHT